MTRIAIISGSHRPTGNSPRIARVVEKNLQSSGHETYLLDLAITDLPYWDEGMWGKEGLAEKWKTAWQPIADEMTKAEALVIVCPEYHGNIPSKLMNLILLLGNGPIVAHKPALLIGVSSSGGGAYPVESLRATAAKNNRMVFLPEHLLVRNADNMFVENPPEEHAKSNDWIQERLTWVLPMLVAYAKGLAEVRATTQTTHPKFANGM